MYIEQLNADDFHLLSFLLFSSFDTKNKTNKFEHNSIRLTIKEFQKEEKAVFILKDFVIVPASELAASLFMSSNLEERYFKFMIQRFGLDYEQELFSKINSKTNHMANSLEHAI